MLGRFTLGFDRARARALTAGRMVFAVSLLAGCSSVPDAVNPVEWYKGAADAISGGDRSETAGPVPAKGLPADKGNSKYADPVRREVAPTKPLARRTPAPADTQVAAAPEAPAPAPAKAAPAVAPVAAAPVVAAAQAAVPPKPVVTTQELPPPPQTAQMRDTGPHAPPASVDMVPPPPADIPETVAPPARGRGKPLQQQFERRLAESAQQQVSAGMVDMPTPSLASRYEDEPIHLVPPSTKRKGGGKGLAAPPPEPAASFQVAALDFRANSSDLTAADRTSIAEVARLYRQTGGVVRVVGHAPLAMHGADAVAEMMNGFEASMKRANAVARELAKRGVPAAKIMVGTDPSGTAMANVGAQVYIDVI